MHDRTRFWWNSLSGAGDGNRTRTVSLGIRQIRPSDRLSWASDAPLVTVINPVAPGLMAR